MIAGLRVGSWVMRTPSDRRNSGMEGAFTHVRGFGDVHDGRFRKPFLREELERGPEKAVADVGTSTLAAAGG